MEVLFVDSNIGGNFCIGIDESMLYFDNKNNLQLFSVTLSAPFFLVLLSNIKSKSLSFISTSKKAQEAICKNIDLIRNYCSFSGGKGSN